MGETYGSAKIMQQDIEKTGKNLLWYITSHRTVCAVQVLIRWPNYSDFSVKKWRRWYELVLEFLVEKLKVSFMWKYANYSIKEMKWRIITILYYFTFPFIKYKHCNIVTILSVRGRLILSTCTALSAGRLVPTIDNWQFELKEMIFGLDIL